MRAPLLVACVLVATAAAQEFSKDIPFVKATSVADVKKEVAAQGKPAMVFVTQPWCGACKGLKNSVSKSDSPKVLMKNFVVVHAKEDEGKDWQWPGANDGYVPRVYFLDKAGEYVAYKAPNPNYKYFLAQADQVETAAKALLKAAGSDEL